MYLEGQGVKQDKAKAEQLFKKACDAGSHEGCTNLAFVRYYAKHGKTE
jgi:TPR repeat protein